MAAPQAKTLPESSEAARAAARRRTFAIISHPDAGKTTLTEKLLLAGGAIHLAGEVRARGEARRTRSDWMKIEQARGISVTTSVMTFDFSDATFNLLDTPGHEDFSEDTYRTLTAVDSAVMVIDAAKGIESQTRKLFEVCRLRDMPIVTFINKIDREGRDPFELLDEVSESLALDPVPMNWPVGMGGILRGLYEPGSSSFQPFAEGKCGTRFGVSGPDDPVLLKHMNAEEQAKLVEDAELIAAACPALEVGSYLEGHQTPVFFGSALKNYYVEDLLGLLSRIAPPPGAQPAEKRTVDPGEDKVNGFVFKVQANMDPKHRDRVAFLRLCSGKFKRGMKLRQTRSGKTMAVHNPILFLAQSRELAEEAWPGDIVGIPNHGTLRVGDTLSEGEELRFTGIPNFAPEILRRVRLGDPLKAKHLGRALQDLAEEGVTQVFRPLIGASWIVGVVGALQLDVLTTRLEAEYGLEIGFEDSPFYTARWVDGDDPKEVKAFCDRNRTSLAEDRDGFTVYMARNAWDLGRVQEDWPKLRFTAVKERF